MHVEVCISMVPMDVEMNEWPAKHVAVACRCLAPHIRTFLSHKHSNILASTHRHLVTNKIFAGAISSVELVDITHWSIGEPVPYRGRQWKWMEMPLRGGERDTVTLGPKPLIERRGDQQAACVLCLFRVEVQKGPL